MDDPKGPLRLTPKGEALLSLHDALDVIDETGDREGPGWLEPRAAKMVKNYIQHAIKLLRKSDPKESTP